MYPALGSGVLTVWSSFFGRQSLIVLLKRGAPLRGEFAMAAAYWGKVTVDVEGLDVLGFWTIVSLEGAYN
jgi:hypothetical protein